MDRHCGPIEDARQLTHGDPSGFLEVRLEANEGVVPVRLMNAPCLVVDPAGLGRIKPHR